MGGNSCGRVSGWAVARMDPGAIMAAGAVGDE